MVYAQQKHVAIWLSVPHPETKVTARSAHFASFHHFKSWTEVSGHGQMAQESHIGKDEPET